MIAGQLHLPDEGAMASLADALLQSPRPLAVALRGPLGAGKTTLARSLLRALGHRGPVRSPTYTLVECYPIGPEGTGARVWHLDLYRLGSSEEVDWLGLDEYERERDWLLVEWPDRGAGHLPEFDLQLVLDYAEPGRMLCWEAIEPDVTDLFAQVAAQGRLGGSASSSEGPGLRAQGSGPRAQSSGPRAQRSGERGLDGGSEVPSGSESESVSIPCRADPASTR